MYRLFGLLRVAVEELPEGVAGGDDWERGQTDSAHGMCFLSGSLDLVISVRTSLTNE